MMQRAFFLIALVSGLFGLAIGVDASRRGLMMQTITSSAAPWTPASLGTNLLFWVNVSTNQMEISGGVVGHSTNTVGAMTNYIVTTGSPLLSTLGNGPAIKFGTSQYGNFAPVPIPSAGGLTIAYTVCFYTNTGSGTLSTHARIGNGYPSYLHVGTGGSDNILSIRESATTRASSPNLTMTGGTNVCIWTYDGSDNATGVLAYLNGSAGSTFTSTVIGAWASDTSNELNSIGAAQLPRGATYGQFLIISGVVSASDRTNLFNYLTP